MVVINSEENIQNMIYVIRGRQVMLDSDLAMLYQVETKVLNQAAKRNKERFSDNFKFQVTKEELDNLKSQIVTSSLLQLCADISSNSGNYGGRRKLPNVYTEQGIAMLSAVLRSEVAIRVSIRIMNTFVEMRRYTVNSELTYKKLNDIEVRQVTSDCERKSFEVRTNERFEQVFNYISDHEESRQKMLWNKQDRRCKTYYRNY